MALKNFSWIIPGKLAGSDIPGRQSLRNDLENLYADGVRCLVSLEKPPGMVEAIASELAIEWHFFPVPDFGIPQNSSEFSTLIDFIIKTFESGKPVCVHCHAGVGRTGLVLSCVVGKCFSLNATKAIAAVRKTRAAIDTQEQEQFVSSYLNDYEY
jgi:protein-tyrosine phosphatase